MSLPAFKIESYREPRWMTEAKTDTDHGRTSTVYGRLLKTRVFTYVGGRHGNAFTLLSTYLCEHTYRVNFPRCYHPRWHLRLVLQFEELVWLDAKKRGFPL